MSHISLFANKTHIIGIVAIVLVTGFALTHQFINAQEQSRRVVDGPVSVEGKIDLITGGDHNKNGEIDAGDAVNFRFDIINPSANEYSFAELQTGIDTSMYFDWWNLRGTVNMSDDDGTITFPNLKIPPRSQITIGVEATVSYFTQGQKQLAVSPQLVDSSKQPVGIRKQSEKSQRQVRAFEGKLPSWIATDGVSREPGRPSESPQPSETPGSKPTPTPENTPSFTPDPTIEPSPIVDPTTTPTANPSPSPSSL
jgi:hypothetical protein